MSTRSLEEVYKWSELVQRQHPVCFFTLPILCAHTFPDIKHFIFVALLLLVGFAEGFVAPPLRCSATQGDGFHVHVHMLCMVFTNALWTCKRFCLAAAREHPALKARTSPSAHFSPACCHFLLVRWSEILLCACLWPFTVVSSRVPCSVWTLASASSPQETTHVSPACRTRASAIRSWVCPRPNRGTDMSTLCSAHCCRMPSWKASWTTSRATSLTCGDVGEAVLDLCNTVNCGIVLQVSWHR